MAEPRPGASTPGERALLWLAAATLAMLGIYLRVRLSTALPQFDPDDDAGYYHVESAFQYRYAKELAFGEAVPSVDVAAQYPEGVRVGRDVSLLMERATALSYRLFGGPPPGAFHRFVILWTCGFSAVGTLALFLLCERLSRSPPLALLCSGCYAVSWAAASATTGRYGFLDFSAPLLFACAGALCAALDAREARPSAWAAAAAAAAALSLASWHSARLILASVWLALLWAAWRAGARSGDRRRVARVSLWLAGGALLAGALSPMLREQRFLASWEFWLGPFVWAFCAFSGRKRLAWLAGFAAAAGLGLALHGGTQGYLGQLLFLKARFLLAKPSDPARLPQEARVLWTGPFDSPTAALALFEFVPLGLLAGVLAFARRRPKSAPAAGARTLEALALFYAAGTALVSQLSAVLVFFLCALPAAARLSPKRRRLWAWLTAAVLAAEGLKCLYPASPFNPVMMLAAAASSAQDRPEASFNAERGMLDWLARNNGGKPVAGPFGELASVLAYSGQPVLCHPKFEARGDAQKALEFISALFSNEEALYRYCRRYGAQTLLYPASAALDVTPEGLRYAAGRPPWREDTAAYRLQFTPEKLSRFSLLYQNEDFRVFSVGRSTAPAPAGERPAVYDLAQFSPQRAADGTITLDIEGALKRRRQARVKIVLARLLTTMGRREEALAAYDEAFKEWPPSAALRDERARLRAALQR